MKPVIRFQLSFMMFLEFFIWGAWFVTMGTYLSKTLQAGDVQNGMAYATQSFGAIIAPFIIGLIADRFFDAQKILGFLHIVGAVLLYWISMQQNFETFYPYLFLYMLLFMPTLALVNSVSFRQLSNPEKEFASLRVWGTIGWIAAGLVIGWFAWEQTNSLVNTFRMAAMASALLGVFSFILPKTPPASVGKKMSIGDIIGLDAIRLLKNKNFLVFFISSMLICIPLAFYYQEANKFLNEINLANAAGKMTLGQASEFFFMIVMPFFFRKLGVKKMLLIGMLAWVVRYVLFAYGDAQTSLVSFLYLGILLHGVCYDFFFVTGQIYTDKLAGPAIKSSAQGMITLATYGAGMMIGFWIAGEVSAHYNMGETHDWRMIWLIPAAIAAFVLIIFMIFFKDEKGITETAEPVQLV